YVIGLLGLGLIAAAFFGDSLKYHGEGSGPLGKIIATGGAAVFVIGLIFILSSGDEPARPVGPEAVPTATAEAGGPSDVPSPATADAEVELTAEQDVAVSDPPPVAPMAKNPFSASELGQGYRFAWTYCSTCCPEGPETCPHTS